MITGRLLDGVTLGRTGPLADLAAARRRWPDRPLLRWAGGEWTVAQFASAVRSAAAELRGLGVRPGERVAIMAGNSARMLAVQYAVWSLGAVEVAVNSELRGRFLRHVLTDSDPALVVADARFHELLSDCVAPERIADLAIIRLDRETAAEFQPAPAAGALASLLYTSGTTGPSKGVMLPHGYFSNFGAVLSRVLDIGPADTGFFTMPFFHVDAHIAVPLCLQTGSALAFAPRFSVSTFWADAERFGVTWFGAVGSMLSALITRGRPPAAVLGRLRTILAAPVPAAAFEFFEDDLGVRVLQMYGQTEADGPLYSTPEHRRRGAAGWSCAGFDVRVAAPDGTEVGVGEAGELQTRPRYPNMITLGYWRRPEATVEAFRDLWFRTGDLVHQDADGFIWYRGRLTDSLRRRGENISAFELEDTVRGAPGVRECAALAVRDELGGEDDIKLVLVLDAGASFDPVSFRDFCARSLPRFARPRYVEVVPESAIVRGPGTGAIQKHLLPAGITADTIDLPAAAAAAD
ncbi:class I adenylate-forming enzyme family protein [Actinomadura formosensis]|uniref:class I adenylate-forming enzyme family protein n=1 Tax=Actinomadura formosensis TaxID=60706 RepID=UPI003D8B8D9F